ncbi:MAG: hypothetical protein ABIJ39_14685 [Chloroflexota bacterium]
MKPFARNLIWMIPSSLGVGLTLSLLDGGTWWTGWLAYSSLLIIGLMGITALWLSSGASRSLGLILLLSLTLRLGLAVATALILPAHGYDTPVEQAGYVFADAYHRDTQAWQLAVSGEPIWLAFDKSFSSDQYGGMLALSALMYRVFSLDAHRPWLIAILAGLTATLGIGLAWKAVNKVWGQAMGTLVAGVLAFYPESLLYGSSQMREAFLITFIIMVFLGVITWTEHPRRAWLWMASGTLGLILFSPGVAVIAVILMIVWSWLRGSQSAISWRTVLITGVVILVAFSILMVGLSQDPYPGETPLETAMRWLQLSASWDTYLLAEGSGWIQNVFSRLPESLHLPFATAYGLTQPVLPAALADPAAWPWKGLGIIRAVGWYSLLPFLVSGLIAAWQTSPKNERRAWIWLWLAAWLWILLSSFRAGGDQWDNPRYRVILLLIQAVLAAKTWLWWRETHNPWFIRIVAVEGVFLLAFTYWYFARYTGWVAGQVHVFVILAIIGAAGLLILLGGWYWDYRSTRRKRT